MNWLTKALSSSVGKKFVMGITGLFLCFFLLVHLGGNILLYVGPDAYNRYAHGLHANQAFLVLAEILLYAAFLAHIYLAFALTKQNLAARAQRYAMKETRIPDRKINLLGLTPDSTMFITGAIVLGFTIVHLIDFKFELRGGDALAGLEPYDKAAVIMSDTFTKIVYGIGVIFLGIHVSHGFASAFQSLGINHPRYNRFIENAGIAFAILVALGFLSFVLVSLPRSDAPPGQTSGAAPHSHDGVPHSHDHTH